MTPSVTVSASGHYMPTQHDSSEPGTTATCQQLSSCLGCVQYSTEASTLKPAAACSGDSSSGGIISGSRSVLEPSSFWFEQFQTAAVGCSTSKQQWDAAQRCRHTSWHHCHHVTAAPKRQRRCGMCCPPCFDSLLLTPPIYMDTMHQT